MANILGKPNAAIWAQRYRAVEQYQRAWRQEAQAAIRLYELTWEMTGVPDNVPITIPSTARAIIEEATDHSDFDPHWLNVHTPTYGLTEDAEQQASRLRTFFPGWCAYQISHMNDVSPFRDYVKNGYLTGKRVYKVVTDFDEWPRLSLEDGAQEQDRVKAERQLERDREFVVPIVLRAPDPMAIYEDPSLGQKRWVIEAYEHTPMEILPLYENWIPSAGSREEWEERWQSDQTMLTVWDCYQIGEKDGVKGLWHQVLINEAPQGQDPMVMGADGPQSEAEFMPNEPFPYIVRFTGFGRQSSGKYEEKARGLLFAVKSLLMAEARRETQLDSIIASYAWPTLFVTGPRTRFSVEWGPNVVNYVPPGVTATTVNAPIPSGPIQQALAVIQAGIERGTFGSVIRGDKPPQTTSAAQLAILSGQARLRFGSTSIHHEADLGLIYEKVGIIIKDALKAPVTIWQLNDTDADEPNKLVLKPDDIPGKLSVHVEVMTDPAEEQERRAQLAILLFDKGLIDLEEARERSGIRDTAAMRRRVLRDKVLLESPNILSALGERYLLESGLDPAALTLEKAMRDLMILRSQQEMQARIMGTGGGANTQGTPNAPANPNADATGGRPPAPTAGEATQAGLAQAEGGPVSVGGGIGG